MISGYNTDNQIDEEKYRRLQQSQTITKSNQNTIISNEIKTI